MKSKATTSARRSPAAPVRTRAATSKKREREIIDAAAEIFHRQGYADTSVQDVADAVGILKGSLYYYIKSKEDLLFRVLEEVHEDAEGIIEEVTAIEAPPLERLRAYFRAHVEYNIGNFTKVAVYYHDFALLSADRREQIIKERQLFERFVVGLIREAQESGDVSSAVDARLAAYSALGMANWVYTWYRPSGKTPPGELADLMSELIVGGLRAARNGAPAPAKRRSSGRKRS